MIGIFEKLKHLTTKAECAWKACASGQGPTHIPVISVWHNFKKDHESANFVLENVRLCASCAGVRTIGELLPHRLQVDIGKSFEKDGKPLPRWETAVLSWRPWPAPAKGGA